MTKNNKIILIVAGIGAAGVLTYMIYKAYTPAKPTTTAGGLPTGVTLNINSALNTIGGWFGANPAPAATTTPTTTTTGS